MSKQLKKKLTKQQKQTFASPFNIYWNSKNYLFLIGGFILVILGYYLLSLGSWNSNSSLFYAPIILIICYVIIFPLSIFFKKKEITKEENQS